MGGLPCLSVFIFLREGAASASSCCSKEQEPMMLPLVTSRNLMPKVSVLFQIVLLALSLLLLL